jgi:hypothetical protein
MVKIQLGQATNFTDAEKQAVSSLLHVAPAAGAGGNGAVAEDPNPSIMSPTSLAKALAKK